jgi:hypothetical protein
MRSEFVGDAKTCFQQACQFLHNYEFKYIISRKNIAVDEKYSHTSFFYKYYLILLRIPANAETGRDFSDGKE